MANLTDSHVSAAVRLLEQARTNDEAGDWAAASRRVYERLSLQLSPVLGSAGVDALFARSLKFNRGSCPGLAESRTPSAPPGHGTGGAQEIEDALRRLDSDEARAASIALYATFFALLTTLIGERLTWQIMQ